MTAARIIISDALTFGLNRLSPGETLDADLGAACLNALNNIADEMNGGKSFLFREILTTGTVTGSTGTLGSTWAGLVAGDEVLGATVAYSATLDVPLTKLTMGQYANIAIKSITTYPTYFAQDGQATVYFYPVPSGKSVTLRTKQVVQDFADLDTDYTMPKGYRSALASMLAEKLAPTLAPSMLAKASTDASSSRRRLQAQAVDPAIISSGVPVGRVARIFRGY